MIFDGKDLGRWLRVNPTRAMTPKVRVETEEVPGRDGSVFRAGTLEPLDIRVAVRLAIDATDHRQVARVRRLVSAALVTDGPRELVLPDEPELAYMAMLTDSGDLDNLWWTGGCEIGFTAFDPVAYGARRSRRLAVGASSFGVSGTWPTGPVFEAVGAGAAVQVSDVATGAYVRTAAPVPAGSKVVVDCGARRTTVGGAPVAVTLGSDYFELDPPTARVSVAGCQSPEVSWRERWV